MLSYFNRLDSLMEKWQSRRKTIKISQVTVTKPSPPKATATAAHTPVHKSEFTFTSASKQSDQPKSIVDDNKENEIGGCTSTVAAAEAASIVVTTTSSPTTAYKLIKVSRGSQDEPMLRTRIDNLRELSICQQKHLHSPSLLYVSIILVSFLCLQVPQRYSIIDASPIGAPHLDDGAPFSPNFKDVGANLLQRIASTNTRERWMNVAPNSHDINNNGRPGRRGPLRRALSSIRNRIGARNTIRVHNAFRDLAWRILSSLSMPTPVIYELRRQNFYSPEDDQLNDSLYNSNTSKTIRSKRLLELLPTVRAHSYKNTIQRASDDDNDEPESFRDRLRMRLDDLVNLSRRSLFGRVVRLPSLFPFKRQEDSKSESSSKAPAGSVRRRLLRRRKKKEADRQIISINGKQYYVDDDGELKELKEYREL